MKTGFSFGKITTSAGLPAKGRRGIHRRGILRLSLATARAFSLVEVIMALGIISFALVGLLGLMPVGMRTMDDALEDSSCSLIARRLLGELKQSSFDAIVAQPMTERYFDVDGQEVAKDTPLGIYRVTVVATANGSPNLKNIVLSISRNGVSRRSFVSYVARH